MDEVLNSIQEKLQKLQDEVKSLKDSTVTTTGEVTDEFDAARDRLMELVQQRLSTQKIVFNYMYAVSYNGMTSSCTTVTSDEFDGIDEKKMATVFEVLSNPRRIKIVKCLIDEPLYANELSQKTGFVGGQLYHHLNILEEAGFIEKKLDKYNTNGGTIALLSILSTLVAGVKISEDEETEKNQE